MTTKERKKLMTYIFVTSVAGVNLRKDFFELSSNMLSILDNYAEIFHIKPGTNGESRARVLWNIMQNNLQL